MVQHIIVCVVSDCLKQDAVPVHIFQSKLHRLLSTLNVWTEIYYSSGNTDLECKKEEEFHYLLLTQNDFGTDDKWHLFETPHGKGAYDRIGRTIKTPIMSRS
jgi:hypothetical protein